MWAQLINAALGIWLMAAPAVLSYGGAARTNDRIVGPLAAAFAVVAASEVMRPLRRANWVCGFGLLIAPGAMGYGGAATINSLIVGVLLLAFASVRGTVAGRYGGGWSSLWSDRALQTFEEPGPPTASEQR
jgi:hypothetical protein